MLAQCHKVDIARQVSNPTTQHIFHKGILMEKLGFYVLLD